MSYEVKIISNMKIIHNYDPAPTFRPFLIPYHRPYVQTVPITGFICSAARLHNEAETKHYLRSWNPCYIYTLAQTSQTQENLYELLTNLQSPSAQT